MEEEATHISPKGEKEGFPVDDNIHDKGPRVEIIRPFDFSYCRGKRDLFAALKGQGAIFSPAIKPLDKGKEKMDENVEDQHGEEREFELIHIDSEEEEKISSSLLQSNNSQTRDLQEELERAKYKYDVLDWEN